MKLKKFFIELVGVSPKGFILLLILLDLGLFVNQHLQCYHQQTQATVSSFCNSHFLSFTHPLSFDLRLCHWTTMGLIALNWFNFSIVASNYIRRSQGSLLYLKDSFKEVFAVSPFFNLYLGINLSSFSQIRSKIDSKILQKWFNPHLGYQLLSRIIPLKKADLEYLQRNLIPSSILFQTN